MQGIEQIKNKPKIFQKWSNLPSSKLEITTFWREYWKFIKASFIFILFSLFNGILPVIICTFASMVKPFGAQYAMAIGYIAAIQLGFLQLGWTIVLTFIYSYRTYKSRFQWYKLDKNEFITFSLFISLIYGFICIPLFFGSSYIYNKYASNHLNTLLGQQQAYYYIYIAWIYTFFSSLVSTITINLQILKRPIWAILNQFVYMGMSILMCWVFTVNIPLSNLNSVDTYKQAYTGLFLATGLSIGSIISFIFSYILLKFLTKFKLMKIKNFGFKISFHLKTTWKTLLVILSIQIIKAICLIGIGLGLQDSVDGLVPIGYQMTRAIWYNILYLLPFVGYGFADAIYFYGFSEKIHPRLLSRIIIITIFVTILLYIPLGFGIYYLVEPLVNFYMANVNTNLMIQYNLVDLNAINLPYLMNTMLKKPEYFNAIKDLSNPTYLRQQLETLLFKPTNTGSIITNAANKAWNNLMEKHIITPVVNNIPPMFERIVNEATREAAINDLVSFLEKQPKILAAVKGLFFDVVQKSNPTGIADLIMLPTSGTFLYLSSWCLLYPLGLILFKGSLVLRNRDIDLKEMLTNLFAQVAVISAVVAFGIKLQYSQTFWMYNAWSFPLFITSILAIIYYFAIYYFTYKGLKPKNNKPKNHKFSLIKHKTPEVKQMQELNKPHKVEHAAVFKDPSNIIELTNVSKAYMSESVITNVLKDVNLEIKTGEFVVILGPSGGGKTTLMNIISGLDRATDGTVNVVDTNLIALNDDELTIFRRENVAYVFQQYGLLPNLTVVENIQIGNYLNEENKKTIYKRKKHQALEQYRLYKADQQLEIKKIQAEIDSIKLAYLEKIKPIMNDSSLYPNRKKEKIYDFKQAYLNEVNVKNNQILAICEQINKYKNKCFEKINLIKQDKNEISIDEILDLLELTEQKDKFPAQLSGGQQQRVSIARAIIKNANILFADEPTGAVDNNMSDKILDIFKVLNTKYHKTIIIVTHNPEIAKLATKVVHIKFGTIQKIEYPKQ